MDRRSAAELFAERAHARVQVEMYQGARRLVPELELAGFARFPVATPRQLAEHRHPGAWEVCWLARGSVWWWAGDGRYEVPAGHIYITRPGEVHGGVDEVMQPCALYWLQIAFPPAPMGVAVLADPDLASGFARLRRRVFPATPALAEGFKRLLVEHRRPRSRLTVAAARAAMLQVLVEVLRAHDQADGQRVSPGLARALRWMEANLDKPLRVAGMARAAGLGVSRFHERFLAEVGTTPAEWLIRSRIAAAKRLLAGSRSVTAIADGLGFASSQYFATVFRQRTGMSPSEYRDRT